MARKQTESRGTIKISRVHLEKLIDGTNGAFFGVSFQKRPTKEQEAAGLPGDMRDMNTRLHVTKNVKGTGHPLGPHTTTRRVWDVQKEAWRSINLATVTEVRTGGKTYEVID